MSQKSTFCAKPGRGLRPEVVVLRIYGDYLVTAPFDRTTKQFEKKLSLLKISEMAEVPLTYEKAGPLHAKP